MRSPVLLGSLVLLAAGACATVTRRPVVAPVAATRAPAVAPPALAPAAPALTAERRCAGDGECGPGALCTFEDGASVARGDGRCEPAPAPAAPRPSGCEEPVVRSRLALAAGESTWVTACESLGEGEAVLAALDADPSHGERAPELRVALVQDGVVRWHEELRLRGAWVGDVRRYLTERDVWRLRVVPVEGEGARGVRVALDGQRGEDYAMVDEVALVYRLGPDGHALQRVWVGHGSASFNAMDVCTVERVVEMRFASAHTLELRAQTFRALTEGEGVDAALARTIRRDCQQDRPFVHRFTVQ